MKRFVIPVVCPARLASCVLPCMIAACGGTPEGTQGLSETLLGVLAAPAPISAPPEIWTWVPFPDALCANNTATGIGVNLTARSPRVLIYLEGGGGCWDAATCADSLHVRNANLGGFGEAQFYRVLITGAPEYQPPIAAGYGASGIFDRAAIENPFSSDSYVYVPYCTADFHMGRMVNSPATGRTHVGQANIASYLARLAVTFPPAPGRQVVLAGSSSGGYGAYWNYSQTRDAFAPTPVAVLDESGAPLGETWLRPAVQDAWRRAWGLDLSKPPEAPSTRQLAVYRYLVQHNPAARFGLIQATGDLTEASFHGIPLTGSASLSEGLSDLRGRLAA